MPTRSALRSLLPEILWPMVLCALTIVCGIHYVNTHPFPDPDQFFHFAVSRSITGRGFPSAIPQVTGLGWNQAFVDKEFFFHLLTAGAWTAGKEYGVRMLAVALAAGVALAAYMLCRRWAAPAVSALCVFAFLLTDHFTVGHNFLVRAYMLAVFAFLLILYGFIRQSALLVAAASLLYALGYHSFHLVLGLAAVCGIAGFLQHSQAAWKKLSVICLLFLALGTVCNPAFPANIAYAWWHLQFALGFESSHGTAVGHELDRLTPLGLFAESPVPYLSLAALLAAAPIVYKTADERRVVFLLALSFALMSLVSPRAREYFFPLAAVSSAIAFTVLKKRPKLVLASVLAAACLFSTFNTWKEFGTSELAVPVVTASLRDAVRSIPKSASGKFVFNCSFSAGPYVLYFRPDLAFLDLLDPRLLEQTAPEKAAARDKLVRGQESEPVTALRNAFDASFVICFNSPLIGQLKNNPAVTQLYPTPEIERKFNWSNGLTYAFQLN